MIQHIILILLFNSIFNEEYELLNGIEEKLTNLESTNWYSFYIKAPASKTVYISLSLTLNSNNKNINDPFSSPSISEYSNRNSTSYTKRNYIKIPNKKIDNHFDCFISYKITNSYTNYISLQFQPSSSFSYLIAKVDIIDAIYNLNNGITTKIYNLKEKETYFFYIETYEGLEVNFNLDMNYMNYTPFSNIYFSEYDNKDLISTKSSSLSIPIISKDNQLISTFTYSVSTNEIEYISIRITPSYNIDYLNIKFEFPINSFDLSNSVLNAIYNLIPGNFYLFFIKATQYAKVNINLNFNSDQQPVNSIYLYEYEKKNNSYSSYLKKEIKNIKTSIKENEYQATISYNIDSYLTNFLAFSINPLYNISYVTIQSEIFGGSFVLENDGTINNIGYLKSNNDYYLYIPAKQFNKVNIELDMNYMDKTPFSYISVSELNSSRQNHMGSYKSHSISMITKNNQLITSFDYFLNQSDSSNYLGVKITPLYDIDSMIAKINIINCLYYSSSTLERGYNLKSGNLYYIFSYCSYIF